MTGRINYTRYTPVYLAEMLALKETFPDMFAHLINGVFFVKRSEKTFNCVPTDQALEQSINREAKSRGGVVKFTLRKGALMHWLLTRCDWRVFSMLQVNVSDNKVQEQS